MALRPIWRGHLRLALVSCPVALYSAKHDRGTIRFHLVTAQPPPRYSGLQANLYMGTSVEEVQTRL